MKFKGDIVHSEKYEDRETKEEKKKYTKVGALFERDDGSLCIKFLGGWLNVYPPKANDKDFRKLKEEINNTPDSLSDEIPF